MRHVGYLPILCMAVGLAACEWTASGPQERDASAFSGPPWVAEDIEGRGVVDFLQSHIAFGRDGEATGFGGCNSFRGQYHLDGHALRIGPLAGTRKACPPAVMDQEARFYAALGDVRGYRFEDDLLHLLDGQGTTVVRLWRRDK